MCLSLMCLRLTEDSHSGAQWNPCCIVVTSCNLIKNFFLLFLSHGGEPVGAGFSFWKQRAKCLQLFYLKILWLIPTCFLIFLVNPHLSLIQKYEGSLPKTCHSLPGAKPGIPPIIASGMTRQMDKNRTTISSEKTDHTRTEVHNASVNVFHEKKT